MKKVLLLLLFCFGVIFLFGCGEDTVVFTGQIEFIYSNSVTVVTADEVGFDKANVTFDKPLDKFYVGQTVEIEILSEIRESYPVSATGIKIRPAASNGQATYKKISADEAIGMMGEFQKNNAEFTILDVRTADEFAEGHIENAILLPYDEIRSLADVTFSSKYNPIFVYCRSGSRSQIASKQLIDLGYTKVYDFGGINDWPNALVK